MRAGGHLVYLVARFPLKIRTACVVRICWLSAMRAMRAMRALLSAGHAADVSVASLIVAYLTLHAMLISGLLLTIHTT
jgi:hypothetical protein